jgi:PTS system cellobiose-specific IIC component
VLNKSTIWLQSIQHGFIATLPVVILGALALTVLQLLAWISPNSGYEVIRAICELLQQACYGLMALTLVLSISHRLAKYYQYTYQLNFDPLIVSVLSMLTLVAMVHQDYDKEMFGQLGVTAIAKGLFCSIIFTELYVCITKHPFFNLSHLKESIESSLQIAISSIWPAILTPIIVLTLYSFVADLINQVSYWLPLFMGDVDAEKGLSLWQTIKLILINQMSWFVGIHGSSIIEMHADTLFLNEISNVYSRQYINVFVHIGGAGSTFGLVLALFFSKVRSNHQLGQYALLPSIFNINELLIFGLPIIFNRYLLFPFIFVPILTACLFRVVFELDLIQWSGEAHLWSTPIFIGGYLATGQWQGVALQFVFILISAAIYHPFLMRYEKYRDIEDYKKQLKMLQALNHELDLTAVYKSKTEMGRFSRLLLSDFRNAISNNKLNLVYQPKVNSAGKVVGAEALLRWTHERFGFINTGVIVELSEVDGSIHDLGIWVIKRCLSDKLALNKAGLKELKVALNVSPCQFEKDDFFDRVISLVERTNIPPSSLELEITEGKKIDLDDRVLVGLQKLSKHGFNIAVDDFGMGYTSLRYLKSFPVNTLKIDGSIVKDVNDSKMVQEIISSMGQLANSMGVTLVAEWVETDSQMHSLIELGCDEFQGYLMSQPISLQDLTHYCGLKGVDNTKLKNPA